MRVDSTVGGVLLPWPASGVNVAITDPATYGLVQYLAHWIRWAFNTKFQTMTEPPLRDPNVAGTTADGCPSANLFYVDPSFLVSHFGKPALFGWWDGKSETKPWTIVKSVRVRTIEFLYVFDRVMDRDSASAAPDGVEGLTRYNGLLNAIEATVTRAFRRRSHPTFIPPGFGFAAGADIRVALGLQELQYLGGSPLGLAELDEASVRAAASTAGTGRSTVQGGISIIYPCLRMSVRVTEEIGADTFNDLDAGGTSPDDSGDLFVTLNAVEGGSELDGAPAVLVGVVPSGGLQR